MTQHIWLIKIGASIGIGLIFSCLESIFYSKLKPKVQKTTKGWNRSLINALHKPLQVFIWLIVFSFMLSITLHKYGINNEFSIFMYRLREILFVLTMVWFLIRFIGNIEKEFIARSQEPEKSSKDVTSVRAVSQLCRVTVIIIAILISMQTFGISITALLAMGGVGGIAIGFAAKDTLANFLGGMMIFWDRPFCVGDWIRSPDRQIEGTVEHIGWRLSCIRTFDKRPLYIPNGIFSTIAIENASRMHNRRIRTVVGVRYKDAPKIPAILKDIDTMIRNHPEIDATQTIMVNFFEFAASSLNILIYTFTKTIIWTEFQSVQEDVFLKILEIINKHNAECAFPTTTLDIPTESLKESAITNVFNTE